ncbi:MAG: triacylglycerol lipase, partial [Pseudonocardiales bacterium]|nr:triacylglycerol lipase [Pseudonocardiales bacterium]
YLMPTPLTRQLMPGSDLLTELAEPAPHCRTRFLVVWSRMDQLIVPQRNARLVHPDLAVDTLELRDVGHMSLSIHPRAVHWVASSLARLDDVPARAPTRPVGLARHNSPDHNSPARSTRAAGWRSSSRGDAGLTKWAAAPHSAGPDTGPDPGPPANSVSGPDPAS